MTTRITVEPSGHHVLVTTFDRYISPGGMNSHSHSQKILPPSKQSGRMGEPYICHATTTRRFEFVDLEPDDARVLEFEGKLLPTNTAKQAD